MTVWIKGDIHLTSPYVFNHSDKNVVILGKLTSESDISFKVNNMVVFGEVLSKTNLFICTKTDFFNSGRIVAKNLSIDSQNTLYNGLDEKAIAKIRALGIDINLTPTGLISIREPH